MKKTHSTNIGGRIFEVEEDAYQKLTTYLSSIATRFHSYPDAKDIVADIEARIAEHLLHNAGSPRIVTHDDVTRVINAMGRADQFGDAAEVPTTSPGAASETTDSVFGSTNFTGTLGAARTMDARPREGIGAPGIARPRLFRDLDECVIAGVASGIAAYFDVSPAWIRLLFLISIFICGSGLLVYVVLWICVPRARTLTDRVRMRGERVTLNTIDQGLRDESLATPLKRSNTMRTIFRVLIACAVIAALLLMGMCIGSSKGGTWTYSTSTE